MLMTAHEIEDLLKKSANQLAKWQDRTAKAEARIRELEANNDKWQLEFNQKHADLVDAQDRIERAEAILKESTGRNVGWIIHRALEALWRSGGCQ